MHIDKNQLDGSPIEVGKLRGKPVFKVKTKGGYHMVLTPKDGGFETLGVGPHIAVAKHIASKREKEILWDINKGDFCPYEDFASCLPDYEKLTERMRELR